MTDFNAMTDALENKVEIHETMGPAAKLMVFVALSVTLITTYVPEISLFLPRLFGLL